MEIPAEVADALVAADPVIALVEPSRPVRRRRGIKAETPIAAIVADPTPVSDPASPATASPTSNPPAAVMADTMREDSIMNDFNTAETVVDTAEQMTGRSQAGFADLNGRAKEAMAKTGHMVEELGAFGKGNVEALVESSKIAAKGMETLGQEAADFSRRSFESATAAMKTLAATRSPTEFLKLQGDLARSMFDTMVAETSKSTEMMMKLASDVAQPISNRVAIAADRIKVAA